MSTVARMPQTSRYGSAAEVSALTGLSVRTIRRRIKDGSLRGVKLGRRVLIPFDAIDRHELPKEAPVMATIHSPASAETPYVPRIDPAELARRNQAAIAMLDSWETDGDEQEQRETMQVLREALGSHRTASSRNLFP